MAQQIARNPEQAVKLSASIYGAPNVGPPVLGAGNKITLLHMFILQASSRLSVRECVLSAEGTVEGGGVVGSGRVAHLKRQHLTAVDA